MPICAQDYDPLLDKLITKNSYSINLDAKIKVENRLEKRKGIIKNLLSELMHDIDVREQHLHRQFKIEGSTEEYVRQKTELS